jgi:hypothetical protein
MKKSSVERLKREYERVKVAHSKLCDKLNTMRPRIIEASTVPCPFCHEHGGHWKGDMYVGEDWVPCSYCEGGHIDLESKVWSWPAWKLTLKREDPELWQRTHELRQAKLKEYNK